MRRCHGPTCWLRRRSQFWFPSTLFSRHAVSEVSTLQCCSSVAADLPLKIPTRTHKMQNSSWKCIYLFLRIYCSGVFFIIFSFSYSRDCENAHVLPHVAKMRQNRYISHRSLTLFAFAFAVIRFHIRQSEREELWKSLEQMWPGFCALVCQAWGINTGWWNIYLSLGGSCFPCAAH